MLVVVVMLRGSDATVHLLIAVVSVLVFEREGFRE